MLIMAERVNHPPHYNAGGIECIDALEAATSGLQGTTNPFLILFDDLDGVTSTGIWNESLQRIEC